MTTDIVVSEYEPAEPDEVELPLVLPMRIVTGESVVMRCRVEEITVTREHWVLVVSL